jgi:phosphoribosylaminoimidazole-succinocarboxamide synthase
MSGTLLYEGKAKKVFTTDDPRHVVMEFKDDAAAFNGEKRGSIGDKGVVNARITAELFQRMEQNGVATCFVQQVDERRLLVERLQMIKLEVVVRNIVAGSLSNRTGLPEGTEVEGGPIVEIYYKDDDLGDPLLNDEHVFFLKCATPETLSALKESARRVNDVLTTFFRARNLLLVDFKLEYGAIDGQVKLGDEITPDTCRLWDLHTREKLDKDRFRRDLGGVEDAYQEVLRRVLAHDPA